MPSGSYQKVANKKDLEEGGLLRVEPGGRPIALAMVNGKIYAVDAVCTHEGGPLDEGKLEGYCLTCPWHYAVFDVRNGRVSDKTVWATDIISYPVQVDDNGDISIITSLPSQAAAQQQPQQQQPSKEATEVSERKYYEEEEKKAPEALRLSLELLEKVKLEGTDIMTFKLSRSGKARMDFAPGQFAFFKLQGVLDDPKGAVRHFSIASSPTESDFILISTRIRDSSPYKQKLASLEKGAKVTAWGPQGDFVLREDKPAVLLSGGIGVTPFRSMIKYATDRQLPQKITMFDSNRNRQSILYRDEFDRWAGENKNIKIVYTVTDESTPSPDMERGRIDGPMLQRHLTKKDLDSAIFYICGPPGMLKGMQELLEQQMQIPKDRVKIESFTGY
ncbi:MAG: Rieske 2Fe-2S domain-containing protein [Nitrososphaera sp.]|jgi:ferredoxin-NADP reductase/nitrite reductase/ring-hydroxylating ferredoxin subunit